MSPAPCNSALEALETAGTVLWVARKSPRAEQGGEAGAGKHAPSQVWGCPPRLPVPLRTPKLTWTHPAPAWLPFPFPAAPALFG